VLHELKESIYGGGFLKINAWLRESNLFKNAEKSKFRPNALLSLIIFFCLWYSSLLLGRFIVIPLIDLLPNSTMAWNTFSLSLRKTLVCGFQITVFFSWVKGVEKRKLSTLGFASKHKAMDYLGGVLLGVASISAIVFVSMIFGIIEVSFNGIFPTSLLVSSLSIAVFGWVIQSASEEIAIRGWLIPTLGVRHNPLMAVLLTGGVFGILHLLNSGATALSFVNLTLSGFFFALFAINAGNIWGVCGLHFGWNYALSNIFGLSVSGEQGVGNSLFLSTSSGKDLLTGGVFGMESSLFSTVFLICAVLLICFIISKKHKAKISDKERYSMGS
jgi:membrane protease YdiL (CAAX protease family)